MPLAEEQSARHPSGAPRLLIVDDEERICQVLERFFTFKGYEVRTVRGGEEAVALASAFHPHVVLLDLLMPGMNGLETFKALKQRLNPPPKVLMLSAADQEEVVKGALELGIDFYLCKPVDFRQLEHLVNGYYPAKKP